MYNKLLMQTIVPIIITFTSNAMEFRSNLIIPGRYYVSDVAVVLPEKDSMAVKAHIDYKNVIVLYGGQDYKKALIVLYQYPVDVDHININGVHNTFGFFNPDKMSALYEKCLMLCRINPKYNTQESSITSISSLQTYIREAYATPQRRSVTIKISIPGRYDYTVMFANIIGLIKSKKKDLEASIIA